MQVTRKIAAAAAVATVATLGLATVVSANMIDDATKGATAPSGLADAASLASKGYGDNGKDKKWYWVKDNGSLVAIDDNNVGPFQACHNFVPVNGVGGQVPVTDITGIIGLWNNGNSATAVKTCEQDSEQNNDGKGKWYRVGNDGLISVSENNVGPFQVCHNEVPVNGVGGQVPVSDLAGVLGIGNNGNSVDTLKTCEQESEQNN
ncbi:hypothetical protein EV643_101426 [Kribbella sp. VKM Ac-2527]|uniref:Secreted protein n=1 Tax=Kribbella caucasensis TaxID=2512215 RepID=A0A4R6KPN4_9ACTN|nr:hypothetical protein [Kribbella sp. VKM Ac-2527]TDO54636.1 hypothetical protein EV643_101426 [Kribbella sp. VKM Ac-2527]